MHQYTCALHIHTHYSDGRWEVDKIASVARELGIDILMITDHHTMASTRHGLSGWRNGVFIIVGYEHSDPLDQNHLLIFGLNEPLPPNLSADAYVREAHRSKAVTFLAHPMERRQFHPGLKAFPWTASLDLPFHGIEVWNYLSAWAEQLSPYNILPRFFFPDSAAGSPDRAALELWDRLAMHRPVAGIAGLDAHAARHRLGPFRATLFSYLHGFRRLVTCVESEDPIDDLEPNQATRCILRSLGGGRSFFGNRMLGSMKGFEAFFDGRRSVWGELFPLRAKHHLRLTAPHSAIVTLIRNGVEIDSSRGRSIEFIIDKPGVYRVELRRRRKFWILSNHFRVVESV